MAHIGWVAIIILLSGCATNSGHPVVGEEVMPPDGYIEMCMRSPLIKNM